jgi:hypothetical protein
MITKQHMATYGKKIGALLVLGMLFVLVASVRADAPYAVVWEVESYYSDTYSMEDVTFVWAGETGNATFLEVTGCSPGNCFFNTSYNEPGEYTVAVYAKNAQGETVSNTASCTANIDTECPCDLGYNCINNRCVYGMEVSCAAYTSANAQNPTLYFNPSRDGQSSEVWWRATITGGTGPYTYSWQNAAEESEDVPGTDNPQGPYYVATIDGGPGDYELNGTYTANLAVRDANNGLVNASCTIATKQCQYDSDCVNYLGYPSYYICSTSTYTCVPPPPLFVDPLAIDPAVVNEGELCGLSWAVEYAEQCDVYKNNTLFEMDVATSTTNYTVTPGAYHVQCVNSVGDITNAGPAQCIYNPEIRES